GGVVVLPRWLRQPRHDGRASYTRSTLASGSRPKMSSVAVLAAAAAAGAEETGHAHAAGVVADLDRDRERWIERANSAVCEIDPRRHRAHARRPVAADDDADRAEIVAEVAR